MTDVPANHVSLRMDNVQLVIAVKRGQRPSIVHWGRALAHSAPEEFEVLSTRQWAFGGPTEDVAPSLSNELGAGLGGPSGLLAHRDGGDWASFLALSHLRSPRRTSRSQPPEQMQPRPPKRRIQRRERRPMRRLQMRRRQEQPTARSAQAKRRIPPATKRLRIRSLGASLPWKT